MKTIKKIDTKRLALLFGLCNMVMTVVNEAVKLGYMTYLSMTQPDTPFGFGVLEGQGGLWLLMRVGGALLVGSLTGLLVGFFFNLGGGVRIEMDKSEHPV